MKVKNSAITYTAYDYQTLQGVKLLAEWLNSPTRYARIAFEADKDANDTPEGISMETYSSERHSLTLWFFYSGQQGKCQCLVKCKRLTV